MNKAVQWTVNGVDSDARAVADEAARRSGLSLGDWLNAVIADRAADMGIGVEEMSDEGRLEAVTFRLARLAERMNDPSPRPRRGETGQQPGAEARREQRFSDDENQDEEFPVRRARRPVVPVQAREAPFREPPQAANPQASGPARASLAQLEERLGEIGRSGGDDDLESLTRRMERKLAELAQQLESASHVAPAARAQTAPRKSQAAPRVSQAAPRQSEAAQRDDLESRAVESASRGPAPSYSRASLFDRPGSPFAKGAEQALSQMDAAAPPEAPFVAPAPVRPIIPRSAIEKAVAEIARRRNELEQKLNPAEEPAPRRHALERHEPPAPFDAVQDVRNRLDRLALDASFQSTGALSPVLPSSPPQSPRDQLFGGDSPRQREPRFSDSRLATSQTAVSQGAVSQAVGFQATTSAAQIDALDRLQNGLTAIESRIAAMETNAVDARAADRLLGHAEEIRNLLADALKRPQAGLESVERALSELRERVDRISRGGDSAALVELAAGVRDLRGALTRATPDSLLRAIDARFEALSKKLDQGPARDSARLGELVDQIESMQETLAQMIETRPRFDPETIEGLLGEVSAKLERPAPSAPEMGRLESLLRDVATKLEAPGPAQLELESAIRDVEAKLDEMADRSIVDADALHQAVHDITATLERPQATHSDRLEELLTDLQTKLDRQPSNAIYLERVESMVDVLNEKIDAIGTRSAAPLEIAAALVDQVRRLTDRIEEVRKPQASEAALVSLQDQIKELSSRLTQSDAGLRAVVQMEQSLDGLFDQLSDTHQSAVDAAYAAAREVAADMLGADAKTFGNQVDRDLIELKDAHHLSEQRVHHTLTVVHDTLEKVVDRLAAVETDLADRKRSAPATSYAAPGEETLASGAAPVFAAPSRERTRERTPATEHDEIAAGGRSGSLADVRPRALSSDEDVLIEPGSGFAPRRRGAAEDAEPRSEQSAFIAAARRAIKLNDEKGGKSEAGSAHQRLGDNSLVDDSLGEKNSGDKNLDDARARARAAAARAEAQETRSSAAATLARLRHFVDHRKKPLLFGLAAILALCSLGVVSALLDRSPNKDAPAAASAPRAPAAPVITGPRAPGQSGSLNPLSANQMASTADETLQAPSAPARRPAAQASAASSAANFVAVPTFAANSNLLSPEIAKLQMVALRGDRLAQYDLANRYVDGRGVTTSLATAAQWFQKAADQGLAPAAYRLGLIYEKGLGVPRDLSKALAWYRKAADAGHIRAMHNLAVLSAQTGADGKPDYAAAAAWFLKASQYGVRDSEYNLAILYARGLGIDRNLEQSYVWFSVAAAGGDTDAAKKRDEVAARLTQDQIAGAKALADNFQPLPQNKAANEVGSPATATNAVRPGAQGSAAQGNGAQTNGA